MEILQKLLEETLQKMPRHALEKVIGEKLREQNANSVDALAQEIADHILRRSKEPFTTRLTAGNEHVNLAIDVGVISRALEVVDKSYDAVIDKLLRYLSEQVPEIIGKGLDNRWANEQEQQIRDIAEFRARLETIWGKPLSELRMLLTICREWCSESIVDTRKPNQHSVLIRLLVRGIQVADEILCLLENGFADGAMARWRTLHEISVVAVVISKFGEDITERYLDHEAVDSMKALLKYQACHKQIGYPPIEESEVKQITDDYQRAVQKHRDQFKSDFGWAADDLKIKRPTFADLENAAGFSEMRSHYQMANMNVHAGTKSMFVRLGLLDNFREDLLPGRSDAGLVEPGQNAAHSLTRLAATVCLPGKSVDDMVVGKIIVRLRDRIPRSFAEADEILLERSGRQSG